MSKILLVEDDETLCDLIGEYLKDAGFDVCVCSDAQSAADLAYEQKFDLFILKPLNTFFQLLSTGRYNAEYPLDEYLVGIFLLIRTSHKLHMFHGWQSIVLFVFLLVTAVFAYFSIIFIMSTLSFWFIKSNMFITLIENLERLIEYPIDIYHAVIRVAVSALIPIALANYYPTVCMLGEGSSGILLYIAGACVILGVIDVLVWKKGMKAYQSTGA